ncbi:MAG: endo-1,4-beta-xylanase [bacterium]|nr:endo-1,4-beta-xylanase [bacterium]
MPNDNRNDLIIRYLDDISIQVNNNYPYLIDDEKLKKAKAMFLQSSDDFETIINQINSIIEQMIEDRKMIVENSKARNSDELSQFTLDLGTEKNGLYLSQQQIDLLIITELSSKEELYNYFKICSQFPNMTLHNIIENYDSIDLETAKRKLYDAYLDTLDSYIDKTSMNDMERAISILTKMGINNKEQQQILTSLKENGLNKTLQSLKSSKGNSFIIQFNRLMRDDFENIKSVGYDEMTSLSRLISRDDSIDTLIIATGKYDNIMASNGSGMYFDPYLTEKALHYCAKHNLHMRYHALFDYSHIEKLVNAGKTARDKKEILTDMKKFVQESMKYIEEHNRTLPDGTKLINIVEVFNELVEKNKTGNTKNQPYAMKWEKEFGITVEDIMSCFEGIKKPVGVEFMYNETTLTESRQKRDKVENVLGQIDSIAPGFIDIFGDQAHLSEEDLKNNGIEIKETAEMLKRIEKGQIRKSKDGNENYEIQTIKPQKIEMTEHDFHFTKGFIEKAKEAASNGIIKFEDIKSIKKNMQSKISAIYKNAGVKFERSTYWSIFNKNDHNLVRANKKIIQENKVSGANTPLIDNMYAGTLDNGKQIDKINSLAQSSQKKINKEQQQIQRESETQSQSFTKRTQTEIKIASQIRTKNQLIAQKKQMSKQQKKSKILVKKAPTSSSSKGYVNALILFLITSFIDGVFLMLTYFIIK